MRNIILSLGLPYIVFCTAIAWAAPPNIVLILADDIGYGDLACYGAAHVKTPNLDRLAREGVRLTDAHATGAVCTPTRYGILTGQYAWRNKKGAHILSGVDPLSVPLDRPTLPSTLRDAGYATALVGKWHLGLGSEAQPVDYNAEIRPGPIECGFTQAFFIPATGDRVPCVFVQDHRVVGLDPKDPIAVSYGAKVGDDPTGAEHPELLKIKYGPGHDKTIVNGISRIGYMSGGHAARWVDEDTADTLTQKACAFIEEQKARPFFLYLATHDIHEPMVPHPRFRGTSDCGWRGDVIQEFDWSVGEVLNTLDRLGLAGNTLIFVTSDNGGAIKDTYDDGTNELHKRQPPNGPLRGQKGDLWEGGHREPFIARWPGHIPAGSTSAQLVGTVDFLATCAAAAGVKVADKAGPDSVNILPALTGEAKAPLREELVLQANSQTNVGLRQGPWMYIPSKSPQLYNLEHDLKEEKNLAQDQPERVAAMAKRLEQIRAGERTRP